MPKAGAAMIAACFGSWLFTGLVWPETAGAEACRAELYAALRAPAIKTTRPVEVDCDLQLSKPDVITTPLVFSGGRASGSKLDCHGATLDGTIPAARTLVIRSTQHADGRWDVPKDITVRGCIIKGDVRIQGLGRNGQAEKVRISSLTPGHTERAQVAAPSGITFSDVTFVGKGGIPLYAAPGVTGMTVEGSHFVGRTSSTAIYLDAESAGNRILGNRFDIVPRWREMIAVDGSARNVISGNAFTDPLSGGIFLYRNCGEGGTIRHQAPQFNTITGNTFRYTNFRLARPAVWLGSRQGISPYCLLAPKAPFGSGLSRFDHASRNVVTGNRFPGASPRLIVDHDRGNTVSDNGE